ncbi:MAG: RNA methyltransferase [Ruminococcus sp.]|nr:RNA methyltransferase [Ruminococcus sp.]
MENIITSKDNPVIRLYQRLSDSKKERLKYGLFVLEGLRIVQDALSENAFLQQIIMTESAVKKYGEVLFQADLRNTRTIVISNELGNRIASTETTQGVFAVCHIPVEHDMTFAENGKYIVLFGLQDPGNVGMIIRTADALGIDGVILSGSCDIYSPKVIRSTMGSVFRTDIHIENNSERLFEMLGSNGVFTSASVIDRDVQKITECSFRGKHAVFIGNEGNGLPSEISAKCRRKITIPMNGTVNSLNAGMASGIIMWELKKNQGEF